MVLTGTLLSRYWHCKHFSSIPHPSYWHSQFNWDCVIDVLSLSCPRPFPAGAEMSAGRTWCHSRKGPITYIRWQAQSSVHQCYLKRIVKMVGGHTSGFDYSISIAQIEIWIVSLLGVPHASSEDDVYEGFFIPKGLFHFSCRFFPSMIFC